MAFNTILHLFANLFPRARLIGTRSITVCRKTHLQATTVSRMAVPIRPEEVPKDLVCPVCLELPQDPYTLKPCSHVFCKDCFRSSLDRSPRKCPMCRGYCTREDLVPMKTGSPLSYRIWANIAVKCGQHSEGCGWVGSLSDYQSHAQSCLQEKKIKSIRSLKEENEKLKIENEHIIVVCGELKGEIESLSTTNEKLRSTVLKLKRGRQDLQNTVHKMQRGNQELLKRIVKVFKEATPDQDEEK